MHQNYKLIKIMTGTDKQLRDYVKNIFNNEDFKIVEMVHSRLNDAVQVTFRYEPSQKAEKKYTEFTEVKS